MKTRQAELQINTKLPLGAMQQEGGASNINLRSYLTPSFRLSNQRSFRIVYLREMDTPFFKYLFE